LEILRRFSKSSNISENDVCQGALIIYGLAKPGRAGTKNICHKDTKAQRIYLLFFLRALVPGGRMEKVLPQKTQNYN